MSDALTNALLAEARRLEKPIDVHAEPVSFLDVTVQAVPANGYVGVYAQLPDATSAVAPDGVILLATYSEQVAAQLTVGKSCLAIVHNQVPRIIATFAGGS